LHACMVALLPVSVSISFSILSGIALITGRQIARARRIAGWTTCLKQAADYHRRSGHSPLRSTMKLLLCLVCSLFSCSLLASAAAQTQVFPTSSGPVSITPLYHASTLIEAAGKVIYLDPAKPADFSAHPKADLILITDIHGDHMDPDSIKAVSKSATEILAPPAVVQTVTTAKPISNGENRTWQGWTIEAIPAYNLKRGPAPGKLFHDKGRGNGYILTYGGKRFYFSGDTEGVPEMRALKNIDVAFVCMNLPYTMPPDEAAEAVKAFHPAIVIPYHYRGSDLSVFQKALAGTGVEVRLLEWYPK